MHDQPFLRNLKFESFHSRCNGIYLIIYGSLNANIYLAIDDFHVVWYNKFNKKGNIFGFMISICDGENMTDRQLLQAVAFDPLRQYLFRFERLFVASNRCMKSFVYMLGRKI